MIQDIITQPTILANVDLHLRQILFDNIIPFNNKIIKRNLEHLYNFVVQPSKVDHFKLMI